MQTVRLERQGFRLPGTDGWTIKENYRHMYYSHLAQHFLLVCSLLSFHFIHFLLFSFCTIARLDFITHLISTCRLAHYNQPLAQRQNDNVGKILQWGFHGFVLSFRGVKRLNAAGIRNCWRLSECEFVGGREEEQKKNRHWWHHLMTGRLEIRRHTCINDWGLVSR